MLYKPLDHASKAIRLIEIHPDDAEAPIRCKFNVASLSDRPRYSALSYTWGPLNPTRTIIIDGCSVTIRENLWHALHSIRTKIRAGSSDTIQKEWSRDTKEDTLHRWLPQYYWIDAICIQQSDILERNHQVTLMANIYSQANVVVTWLGLEGDSSNQAMAELQKRTFAAADKESVHISSSLKALGNRDYWSRVWIVQEVVLAKRLILLCGDMCCDWVPFTSMIFWLGNTVAQNVLRVRHAWIRPDRHTRPDLRSMVLWLQNQKCEDPRDRIYGMLGLLQQGAAQSQLPLRPDYNKTLDQVFRDVARYTFSTHRGDDLAVIISSTADDILMLPSSRTRDIGCQFLEISSTMTATIGKLLVLKTPRVAQQGMDVLYMDKLFKGLLKAVKSQKKLY